jgi:hypothetical protein
LISSIFTFFSNIAFSSNARCTDHARSHHPLYIATQRHVYRGNRNFSTSVHVPIEKFPIRTCTAVCASLIGYVFNFRFFSIFSKRNFSTSVHVLIEKFPIRTCTAVCASLIGHVFNVRFFFKFFSFFLEYCIFRQMP